MKRVLVTGAGGQVGRSVLSLATNYSGFSFHGSDRAELPLDKPEHVQANLQKLQPSIIINCAAYTAVDKAEEKGEKELLHKINAQAVGELAEYARKNNCRLVHLSTDYVFNGKADRPYKEEDAVDPVNEYGASKLKGEEYLRASNKDGLIIRTSWVYAKEGKNFVNTMLKAMTEKDRLTVVNDQRGTPTWAMDLARVILGIVSAEKWHPGLYHYSNAGETTWFGFASEIKRIKDFKCRIEPVTTDKYPTAARRPAYSVLDKSRISRVFGLNIPDWKDSLRSSLSGKV